jgi:hypothetical protein
MRISLPQIAAARSTVPPVPGPGAHPDARFEKKEKCAVFGIWAMPPKPVALGPGSSAGPSPVRHELARLTYLGLYALQHRGQESTGMTVNDGRRLTGVTGMGLVPEVFDAELLEKMEAAGGDKPLRSAIGHNRYSTAGGSVACNAQPIMLNFIGGQIAIAHNGNLINNDALRLKFEQAGHIFQTTSDTEAIVHLLASPAQQQAHDPLVATLRKLQGAFSLVLQFPDRIEAARDPWGWRPLVLGRIPGDASNGWSDAYVVASETVALDVIGATLVREVEPGEIVTLSDAGVSSRRFAEVAPQPAYCIFEHVYFANPASVVFGQNVQATRERLGEIPGEGKPAADRRGLHRADARLGAFVCVGLCAGEWRVVSRGDRTESVCGEDVHQADAAEPNRGGAAEVEHHLRTRAWQEPGNRGRFGGAWHDDEGEDGPVASRGREGVASANLVPADQTPMLLRRGLRGAHAADRAPAQRRGHPRVPWRRLARVSVARWDALGDEASGGTLLHRVLQRRISPRSRPPALR